MIPLQKNLSILIMLCIGVFSTALAFGFSSSGLTSNLGTLIPIVLIFEFFIYAGTAFFASSKLSIPFVIIHSISLLLGRAVLAILAYFVGTLTVGSGQSEEFATQALLLCWVGSPISVLLQILLMLLAGSHLVDLVVPGTFESSEPKLASVARRGDARASQEGKPSGGFIQVYSFEELSGLLKKTPGLEGFLIYSREGFVVWNDVPHKVAVDQATAYLLSAQHQLNNQLKGSGMSEVRRLLVESRDHLIFVSELNQNFGLILLFNQRTRIAECEQRLQTLDKTVREFLQWKYPGLSLNAPLRAYKS
jgi:predicted regulator of Ras-like GTPase activity (Roadblock/LC7/MglB family)